MKPDKLEQANRLSVRMDFLRAAIDQPATAFEPQLYANAPQANPAVVQAALDLIKADLRKQLADAEAEFDAL